MIKALIGETNLVGLNAHEKNKVDQEKLILEFQKRLEKEMIGQKYWEITDDPKIVEHICKEVEIHEQIQDTVYLISIDGHYAFADFYENCYISGFKEEDDYYLTYEEADEFLKILGESDGSSSDPI